MEHAAAVIQIVSSAIAIVGVLWVGARAMARMENKVSSLGAKISSEIKGIEDRVGGQLQLTNQQIGHLSEQFGRLDRHMQSLETKQHHHEHRLTVLETVGAVQRAPLRADDPPPSKT